MFAHTTPIRKVLRGEEEDMNFEFGIHVDINQERPKEPRTEPRLFGLGSEWVTEAPELCINKSLIAISSKSLLHMLFFPTATLQPVDPSDRHSPSQSVIRAEKQKPCWATSAHLPPSPPNKTRVEGERISVTDIEKII